MSGNQDFKYEKQHHQFINNWNLIVNGLKHISEN